MNTLSSLETQTRYAIVKDFHNVLTNELVMADVLFDHYQSDDPEESKALAIGQAEIWRSDFYTEFQNVRVIKITTTFEEVNQ